MRTDGTEEGLSQTLHDRAKGADGGQDSGKEGEVSHEDARTTLKTVGKWVAFQRWLPAPPELIRSS